MEEKICDKCIETIRVEKNIKGGIGCKYNNEINYIKL